MTARYAGKCTRCGGQIKPGQPIDWDRTTHATQHIDCPSRSAQTAPQRSITVQTSGHTHSHRTAQGPLKHCWECGCAYHGRECPRCGEEE